MRLVIDTIAMMSEHAHVMFSTAIWDVIANVL